MEQENGQHGEHEGSGDTVPAPRQEEAWLEARTGAGQPGVWYDLEDEQEMDWRRHLEGVWRRKWLVVGMTVLGVAAGLFLSQRASQVYETTAAVWLGPAEEQSGPIRPTEVFQGRGWADLMVSQAVLKPVALEERLYLRPVGEDVDPDLFDGLLVDDDVVPGHYRVRLYETGQFNVYRDGERVQAGRLGRDTLGATAGFRWHPADTLVAAGSALEFRLVQPSDAANQIRERLTVDFSGEAANLLNTRLEWDSPAPATRIHNRILDVFLDVAERLKSQKQREIVNILQEQADQSARRLDSAELALESFKVQTVTLPTESEAAPIPGGVAQTRAPVFDRYFDRKLEREQLEAEARELRDVLERMRRTGEVDVLALRLSAPAQQSQRLQAALEELNRTEAELRTLLDQYTERYPPVQELQADLRALTAQQIPAMVAQIVSRLEDQVATLDRQIESQASELRQIPSRTITEARLERQVDQSEQLHVDLQSRLKEAELAASTSLPNLQVVDRATTPSSPARDPAPRFLTLASLAGLGLGLFGAVLLDRVDRRVHYPDQVTDDIGLEVIGMIPRLHGRRGDEVRDEALEAFRAVRSQLVRQGDRRHSVFMVTSPSPREGKTLVSANLAISFAAAGSRVLVIDGDTRRGNLEKLFQASDRPGLTNFLSGSASIDDVVQVTEFERLHFIGHGEAGSFEPDLLDSGRMDELLRDVRGRYDVVVMDSPPLMAGTDALVLGERSDRVLVVLRTGRSDQEAARARLTGIGHFDIPLAGAILNDVPANSRYRSYYYYSYRPAGEGAGRRILSGQA